ncbi:MAG: YceI family protein [Actinocatenispora sp.]
MEIAAGRYRFGGEHGQLVLHTSRTGLGRKAGHDLAIEATRWSGETTVGDTHDVQVAVEIDGLEVRTGSGGLKPLTDHDRREIRRTLRGEKLLAANVQPTITFHATEVSGTSDRFELTGDLTVAGTTRPVTVRGSVSDTGRVRGTATIVQSRWGIKPYTAFFGALRLADEVEIEFDTALDPVTG